VLDEKTLLCLGGQDNRGTHETTIFTLEVETGRVTLLRRKHFGNTRVWSVFHVWRDGQRVMGAYQNGLAEDLLKPGGPFRPWPGASPAGWPFGHLSRSVHAAVVKGRRFVSSQTGIREIDPSGKVLRAWGTPTEVRLPLPFHEAPFYKSLDEPGMLPGFIASPYRHIRPRVKLLGHDDAHLFVEVYSPTGLLCYDVEADTWYGPVKMALESVEPAGMYDPKGLWVRNKEAFLHVRTAKVIAASKKAGRFVTSRAFREQRLAMCDAAPPLDAAKFAIALRRFDQAKSTLANVLSIDPENAEALLVMGFLHDRHCLNQPEVAMDCYERLAAIDAPPAALAGKYCLYVLHIHLGNWSEALPLGKQIVENFKLPGSRRDAIVRQNGEIAKRIGTAKK